eukprot:265996-Amphidinium_carterae.1
MSTVSLENAYWVCSTPTLLTIKTHGLCICSKKECPQTVQCACMLRGAPYGLEWSSTSLCSNATLVTSLALLHELFQGFTHVSMVLQGVIACLPEAAAVALLPAQSQLRALAWFESPAKLTVWITLSLHWVCTDGDGNVRLLQCSYVSSLMFAH